MKKRSGGRRKRLQPNSGFVYCNTSDAVGTVGQFRERQMKRLLIAAVGLFLPAVALGEARIFTIDPAQSTLRASGMINYGPAWAQGGSSDIVSYSGQIAVDLGPGTLSFLDNNTYLMAGLQPTPQQPDVDGWPGWAWANYGLTTTPGTWGNRYLAVRDLLLTLLGGQPIALTGQTFDPKSIEVFILDGQTDFNSGGYASSGILDGRYDINDPEDLGSLTTFGSVQTLSIPIDVIYVYSSQYSNDSRLNLTGQIVATATVPEPAGLLALGLGALLFMRRRRSRNG